jgi:hypothetical protein
MGEPVPRISARFGGTLARIRRILSPPGVSPRTQVRLRRADRMDGHIPDIPYFHGMPIFDFIDHG